MKMSNIYNPAQARFRCLPLVTVHSMPKYSMQVPTASEHLLMELYILDNRECYQMCYAIA